MPIGGENIGRAYIAILADGDGLDESIRENFDGSKGAFRDSGREGYSNMLGGWEEEGKKSANQRRLQKALTNAIARGNYLEKDFFQGGAWKTFRQSLAKRFDEAGLLAADNLEKGLRQGMSFDDLSHRLDNLTVEITKAQRQLLAKDKDILRQQIEIEKAHTAAIEENVRRRDALQDEEVATTDRNIRRLHSLFDSYMLDINKINRGEKDNVFSRRQLIKGLRDLGGMMDSAGGMTHEFASKMREADRAVRLTTPSLNRVTREIDTFAGHVGRAFGRGARNNFVNIIGILAEGLVRLASLPVKVGAAFISMGQKMGLAFANAETTFGGLLAAVGELAVVGVPALIALAGAAVILVAAIGPLIAIASGLLGIIIALAGSISFALIGAVTALAGALVPLVAAIGAVVIGLVSMNKEARKSTLRPLVKEFKDLGDAAGDVFQRRLPGLVKSLAPVIGGLRPLFRSVTQAVFDVGDSFAHAMSGTGFKEFRNMLELVLPGMIRSLGRAFKNTLSGLGGVFTAAVPFIQDFLGWLDRVTKKFANWANSTKGQNSLARFFDRAGQSIKSVGNFIGAVTGLLVELLDKGKATGDNIFDSMANSIRRFTRYLQDNPKALSDFFANAKNIADDIGGIVQALGRVADAFDDADSRAEGSFLLHGFGIAIGSIVGPTLVVTQAISKAIKWIKSLGGAFGDLKRKIANTDYAGYFKRMLDALNPLKDIGRILGPFKKLGSAIASFFHQLPHASGAKGAMSAMVLNFAGIGPKIAKFFTGIPGRIRGILNQLGGIGSKAANAVQSRFSGITGKITKWFTGIPGRIRGILNQLGGIASRAANTAQSRFSGMVGKVAKWFAPIPGRIRGILNQLGGIASAAANAVQARFSGIVGRIASKFSGLGGAVRGRLNDAISAAGSVASAIVGKFSGLAGRIVSAIGSIHLPTPTINWPHIPAGLSKFVSATGGTFAGAQWRIIGEAGPEAVVPLNRPLSQVDPSVRLLSAIAQGKFSPAMAAGGVGGKPSKTIDASGWTIVTPNIDTQAVAAAVVNRLVARGY